MFALLFTRLEELILSVYLYNEWRGYTQLEEVLIPYLEGNSIDFDPIFIKGVRKHALDEKKHYQMFKNYFITRKRKPFSLGKSVGFFDLLILCIMGPDRNLDYKNNFARLCQIITITEHRGIQQIRTMLNWRWVRNNGQLRKIFQVIQKDEPSHFGPYEQWLAKKGYRKDHVSVKLADCIMHYFIAIIVIPAHFFNFRLKRLEYFPA